MALIERRRVGETDVEVSCLGLGCAPLGNLYSAVSDLDATQTIAAALDAGINYFDVAPLYGLGLAERRLGAALRGVARDRYVISTKVGRRLVNDANADGGIFGVPAGRDAMFDFSRDGVLRSLESSLDRLGIDHLDIVLIHDPDDHEDDARRHALTTLVELREQGVVRAIGVGMNQSAMLERFVTETDVDLVLLAGRWTLVDRSGQSLLDQCAALGVSVVVGGVFNSGLLASPGADARFDYAPAPASLIALASRLGVAADRAGTSLPALALAFAGSHPAVTSILVGCRRAAEVTQNVAAFTTPPDRETFHALCALS